MFNDVVKIFRKFFKNNLLALKTKKKTNKIVVYQRRKEKQEINTQLTFYIYLNT